MKRTFKALVLGTCAALTLSLIPAVTEMNHAGVLAQQYQEMPRLFEQLDLTEAQKTELESIFASAREQVSSVLTEEQRQTLRASLQNGDKFRDAVEALNLSDAQRSELRQIMQSSHEAASAVLTDEQKAELRELRQARRERRSQETPN